MNLDNVSDKVNKYLQEHFQCPQCKPRDIEHEKRTILLSKIQLLLLTTLGRTTVHKWLPGGYQDRRFYYINQYRIVTEEHFADEDDFNYFAHEPKRFFALGEIHGHNGLKWEIWPSMRASFCELYARICNVTQDDAINDLADKLKIDKDDVFSEFGLDKRASWQQVPTVPFSLGWSEKVFNFYNENNIIQYSLLRTSNGTTQAILPMTDWINPRVQARLSSNIPFASNLLYNLNLIRQSPDAIILLTNSIETAEDNQKIHENVVCESHKYKDNSGNIVVPHIQIKYEFVWSSWHEVEGRAIDKLDLESLRDRTVYYALNNNEKESYKTAMAIYSRLKNITPKLFFIHSLNNSREKHAIFLDQKEFLQKAVEMGLKEPARKMPTQVVHKKQQLNSLADIGEVPPVNFLLEPIIPEKSITLLYADAGIGKTWLTLSMGVSLAMGCDVFKYWKTNKTHKVLYIDSEMAEDSFKRRLKIISRVYMNKDTEKNVILKENFFWRSMNSEMLNLAEPEDQEKIESLLDEAKKQGSSKEGVSLLILDNLSTLSGFNDSGKSWRSIFNWLKGLKEKGCSVILDHHAGKVGSQRGSSIKEATVDNIIKLEKEDAVSSSKVAMSISIEKVRDAYGLAKIPFAMELTTEGEKPGWKTVPRSMTKEEQIKCIKTLTEKGKNLEYIERYTGLSKRTIGIIKKKAGITRSYNKKNTA